MKYTKLIMTDMVFEKLSFRFSRPVIKKQLKQIFDIFTDEIVNNGELALTQAFTIITVDKSERPGRNPITGEPITVTARTTTRFTAHENKHVNNRYSKAISDIVANEGIDLNIFHAVYNILRDVIANHDTLEVRDFGCFRHKYIGAIPKVNPQTGESLGVREPRQYMSFRPAKGLLARLNP